MNPATELWTERVLLCAEQVPRGRVVSYGDIAAITGRGPRWVGRVMATHGGDVCWWRVTNAAGDLPAPLLDRAYPHWVEEGILLKENRRGCRINRHRADLDALAGAYEREIARVLADAGLALPPLSAPARRALDGAGVRALEDLTEHRRADLAGLHGVGAFALRALDRALEEQGLAYRV